VISFIITVGATEATGATGVLITRKKENFFFI
jgi:hypothetical protein